MSEECCDPHLHCWSMRIFFCNVLCLLSQIQHTHGAVGRTGAHFVPSGAPAHLEDAASASVAVNEIPTLSVPDVHALVKGATGQVFPVRAKSYTIDRFLVLG